MEQRWFREPDDPKFVSDVDDEDLLLSLLLPLDDEPLVDGPEPRPEDEGEDAEGVEEAAGLEAAPETPPTLSTPMLIVVGAWRTVIIMELAGSPWPASRAATAAAPGSGRGAAAPDIMDVMEIIDALERRFALGKPCVAA